MTFNGSAITRWNDKSSVGNFVSQATVGNAPTLGTSQNGLNTVYFASANQQLVSSQNSATPGNASRTVISLFWSPTLSSAFYTVTGTEGFGSPTTAWGLAKNPNADVNYPYTYGVDFYTVVNSTPNPILLYTQHDSTASALSGYFATVGATAGTTTVGNFTRGTATFNTTAGVWYIGKRQQEGTGSVTSHLMEMIQYNVALSTSQRQEVEGYLIQKWGLQGQLPQGHVGISYPFYRAVKNTFTTQTYYNPLSIAGCLLWFDAADSSTLILSGTAVTRWNDKSGNGYYAASYGGTVTSSTNPINGLNSIFFGSWSPGGALAIKNSGGTTSLTLGTSMTIFIVARGIATNNGGYFFFTNSGFGAGGVATGPVFNMYGSFYMVQGIDSVLNSYSEVNYTGLTASYTHSTPAIFVWQPQLGTATLNGNVYTSGAQTMNAGSYAQYLGSVARGDMRSFTMGEVLVYNSSLSANQRQIIESYLALKWGITPSLPAVHPNSTVPAGIPRTSVALVRATANTSYANTPYYNVSPVAWSYNWQKYLQSLVAANSGATRSFSSTSVSGTTSMTNAYLGGVLAPNGKIYCIPRNAVPMGQIDTTTNAFTTFGPTPAASIYVGGVLAPNGKIYCIPAQGTSVDVVDPSSNTVLSNTVSGTAPVANAYAGGVLAPNGKIYCIPFFATSVGVIDPVANTFTIPSTMAAGTITGTGAGDYAYEGGVLAPNGKIYCIPCNATTAAVIDPITNTFTTFGTAAGNAAFLAGVLAPNGKVYCIPYGSTSVGVIDPVLNTFNTTTVTGTAPGNSAYQGGVLGPDGKIYCIPFLATSIGVIDPVANTFTTFGTTTGSYDYIGGILAPNGNIYFIPFAKSSVGVISFTGLKQLPSLNYCLSAYTNKL